MMSVMEETILQETIENKYALEHAQAEYEQAACDDQEYCRVPPEISFGVGPAISDPENYSLNERDIRTHNEEAMAVDTETLDAFLDLLASADAEYLDAAEYVEVEMQPANLVDWNSVDMALAESQKMLLGVQNLLSSILEEMGVEDYQYLRVYSDPHGMIRLVGGHDRQEEIEAVLNSPKHKPFRDMYDAANTGMGVAGSLVGNVSVPNAVLEQYKAKQTQAV